MKWINILITLKFFNSIIYGLIVLQQEIIFYYLLINCRFMKKYVLVALSAILLGTSCATTSVVNDPLPSYSRFSTSHSFIHGKADMTAFKHIAMAKSTTGKSVVMDDFKGNIRKLLSSHFVEISADTIDSAVAHGIRVLTPYISTSTEIGEGGKSNVLIMLYDYNTDDNVATITATSQETDIADEHTFKYLLNTISNLPRR